MEKIAPKLVALLGGVGLSTTLAYFLGVYLAFQPRWGAWSTFFIAKALPLMLVPYLSLTAYLFFRSRLGGWLVDRGAYDQAVEYSRERLDASLLRSKKETHLHRIALGRAHIAQQQYQEAYRVLAKGYAVPNTGQQGLEIHRWRIEAALRLEDLVRCHDSYDAVSDAASPVSSRVYVLGCRLEMAVREKNRTDFERFIDEAEWTETECKRVDLARALGLIVFESDETSLERALGLLEAAFEDAVEDVPGRRRGLLAWRARALTELGRLDEAHILLEDAGDREGDARSDYVVEEATQLFESHTSQDRDRDVD